MFNLFQRKERTRKLFIVQLSSFAIFGILVFSLLFLNDWIAKLWVCVVTWVVYSFLNAYYICGETIRVLRSISYNEITK